LHAGDGGSVFAATQIVAFDVHDEVAHRQLAQGVLVFGTRVEVLVRILGFIFHMDFGGRSLAHLSQFGYRVYFGLQVGVARERRMVVARVHRMRSHGHIHITVAAVHCFGGVKHCFVLLEFGVRVRIGAKVGFDRVRHSRLAADRGIAGRLYESVLRIGGFAS